MHDLILIDPPESHSLSYLLIVDVTKMRRSARVRAARACFWREDTHHVLDQGSIVTIT